MTIHVKTALILLVTISLGILLGVLISGAVMRRMMTPGPGRVLPEFFVTRFERLIDPDEAQRDTVHSILESYSERFIGMQGKHHKEIMALMDSMNVDLSSVVTEEQLRRIVDHMERRHRLMEGPPPFRRGRPKP